MIHMLIDLHEHKVPPEYKDNFKHQLSRVIFVAGVQRRDNRTEHRRQWHHSVKKSGLHPHLPLRQYHLQPHNEVQYAKDQ